MFFDTGNKQPTLGNYPFYVQNSEWVIQERIDLYSDFRPIRNQLRQF